MPHARLYLDGSKSWWVLAKCDACQNVRRYAAEDAACSPLDCLTCGCKVDARQCIREEVDGQPDLPTEIRRTLGAVNCRRTA